MISWYLLCCFVLWFLSLLIFTFLCLLLLLLLSLVTLYVCVWFCYYHAYCYCYCCNSVCVFGFVIIMLIVIVIVVILCVCLVWGFSGNAVIFPIQWIFTPNPSFELDWKTLLSIFVDLHKSQIKFPTPQKNEHVGKLVLVAKSPITAFEKTTRSLAINYNVKV